MPYRVDIPGQVSVHQLRAIEAVASLVPAGGIVVEVGSLFGRSSWAWGASVAPGVEVYCLDPWEKNSGVQLLEARHGVKYGLEQFVEFTRDLPNIKPRRGYSPASFLDWDRPIDLYYEDAVHTDPILADNLDFWTSKLKPTGIACGDDYRPRFPDVRAGAQRLAKKLGRELVLVENFWCLIPTEREVPGAKAVVRKLRAIAKDSQAERRKAGFSISIGPPHPMQPVVAGTSPALAVRIANDSLDPWPVEPAGELAACLQILTAKAPRKRLAEARVPTGASVLQPDMPVDVSLAVPGERLPPGSYVAVFDLQGADGKSLLGRDPGKASGAAFEVVPRQSAPVRRDALFPADVVRRDFTSAAFADSHGAFDRFLGAGSLYYGLAHAVRAQVAVCIGSGGGFVPSLLRRAQLDLGIEPACTYLVDANLPELGFGSPVQAGGWMTGSNAFLRRENDIVVLAMLSTDAAKLFAAHGLAIDFLHIDGNHSTEGVLADFRDYAPLLAQHAVVTLHDLRLESVSKALATLLARHPDWQALTFPEIGAGTVILRRVLSTSVPRRPQTLTELVDAKRVVTLDAEAARAAVEESRNKARFERWDYLTSAAYRLRYDLVARFLDDTGATVVEIGGYPNSVARSFTKARRFHAIEPYAPPEFVEQIERDAAAAGAEFFLHRGRLGAANLEWANLGAYRLVVLGLDLTSGSIDEAAIREGLAALVHAISGAERVAIEAPRYAPSLATLEVLEGLVIERKLADVTLDLSKDPAGEEYYVKDARAIRRLLVFEPVRGLDPRSALLHDRLATAAHAIHEARTKEATPVEVRYRLGEEIDFTVGGNAAPFKREGWVAAERGHSWTSGPESWLVLDLEEPRSVLQSATGYELRIEAKPFVAAPKLKSQTLSIAVNGHEVHTGSYCEPVSLAVDIPASAILAGPAVRIHFSQPTCRRPAEVIEGHRDQKLLGFAFQKLALVRRD